MTDSGRRLAAALDEGMARLADLLARGDLDGYRREAPEWERLIADAEGRLSPVPAAGTEGKR
jgi:hypothetical protein